MADFNWSQWMSSGALTPVTSGAAPPNSNIDYSVGNSVVQNMPQNIASGALVPMNFTPTSSQSTQNQPSQPSQPRPLTQKELWNKQWYASGNTGERPAGYHGYSDSDISWQDYQNQKQQEEARQQEEMMRQISGAYDQMKGTLEGMKGVYGQSYQNAQDTINQGLQGAQSQIDLSKQTLGESNRAAQGSLYNNLIEQQAQNRGIARAFGGMGSGFEQGNTRLQQGYSTNAANLANDYASKVKQLDLASLQAKQDYTKMLNDAKSQYDQNLYQIALNQNQTDLQKAQSLQQAQQNFQNIIAQRQAQLTQFQQQIEAMKLQAELNSKQIAQQASATPNYLDQYQKLIQSQQQTPIAASSAQTTTSGAGYNDWLGSLRDKFQGLYGGALGGFSGGAS